MALVAPIGDPSFQAFIYPIWDPDDVLLIDLYPDQTKVTRGTHVTSTPNSAWRDVVQVGGLKAITQTHTLIFDDTLGHEDDMTFMGARDAEKWVEEAIGRKAMPGRRYIFRTNILSEYPMWCAIESQGSEVLYAPAGIIRTVKWDFTLKEVPASSIDPALFGAARKTGKPRRQTRKEKSAENAKREADEAWKKHDERDQELRLLQRNLTPENFRYIVGQKYNGEVIYHRPPLSIEEQYGPSGVSTAGKAVKGFFNFFSTGFGTR